MTEKEKVLSELRWVLNDIEENGHYQVKYYAEIVRAAIALLEKTEDSGREKHEGGDR